MDIAASVVGRYSRYTLFGRPLWELTHDELITLEIYTMNKIADKDYHIYSELFRKYHRNICLNCAHGESRTR